MDSAKFIKETNDIFGFELEEPSPSSIRELTDNLRGRKNITSSTKKNIAETFNERKNMFENKKMVDVTGENKYDADDADDADFQMAIKLSLKETVDKNVYMDENEKLKRELEELKREREEEKRRVFDNLQKERERNEKLQRQLEKDREEENKKMLEILRKEQEEREEQKQLEELYKQYRASMDRERIVYTSSSNCLRKDVLEIHIARNEVILRDINDVLGDNIVSGILFTVTNTGLYCHYSIKIQNLMPKMCIRIPVYIFTEPLSLKYAKLLIYVLFSDKSVNAKALKRPIYYYRDIESVIRLIPGHYKNGNWRQLDGFFGMYYNDVTNELSHIPPAVEE